MLNVLPISLIWGILFLRVSTLICGLSYSFAIATQRNIIMWFLRIWIDVGIMTMFLTPKINRDLTRIILV
jgi:hypothetical protein